MMGILWARIKLQTFHPLIHRDDLFMLKLCHNYTPKDPGIPHEHFDVAGAKTPKAWF